MTKFTKKWEEATVTISRRELGDILATEINRMIEAGKSDDNNDELDQLIARLLLNYAARIGAAVFRELDDDDEAIEDREEEE